MHPWARAGDGGSAGWVRAHVSVLGKSRCPVLALLLGAWVLLLGATWRLAPAWDQFTQGGDATFLPEDAPSRRGRQLFKTAFPDEFADSNIVLVVTRDDGGTGLREQDKEFIGQVLTPALKQLAEEENQAGPGAGSADGAAEGQSRAARGPARTGRAGVPSAGR